MAQESWNRDKEETGCQPPEGPILCANNCGFFGSKAAMNLCSKCYRDIVLAQAKASSVQAAFEKTHVAIQSELRLTDRLENMPRKEAVAAAMAPCDQVDGNGTTIASSSTVSQDQNPNRPPNRCFTCNKRVGLTGFKCRCGDVFCSLHRYSDKHNCSFDYKAAGRDAIAKANPIVKASKLDKI